MGRSLTAILREEGFLLTCAAVVIGSAIAGGFGLWQHDPQLMGFLVVPAAATIAFGLV